VPNDFIGDIHAGARAIELLEAEDDSGGRDKLQGYAVIAPALAGWLRAILEYMALMATAACAVVFRAR